METRPAPLDRLALDENSIEEFRVTAPRDIQLLLKQLLDGSVLLSLHASDGSVVTSAIWTLDSARGTIGFNADPSDPAMHKLLDGGEVVVAGYLDSVKLQFDVDDLVLVKGQRASVLTCAAPRIVYRFQRRNAFRVRLPVRSTPTARFFHPDMPQNMLTLRVLDVSIGGCGLFLPADTPAMNPGTLLQDVRMELDDDTRLDLAMRLQHITSANAESPGVRLGLEFHRLSGDAQRTLQRFIDLTQKRGKLLALK